MMARLFCLFLIGMLVVSGKYQACKLYYSEEKKDVERNCYFSWRFSSFHKINFQNFVS